MASHYELSNEAFLHQLKTTSLDPSVFSHEAHLRFAWLILKEHDLAIAQEKIAQQIQAYTKALGAGDKYHATLTIAAVKVVHHFMQKSTATTFKAFIVEFPRLKTHFKALLAQHYSYDIYNSTTAQANYLAPDLLAF